MKRVVLVLSIVLVATTAINAQFLRYGIKGGLNSSEIKIDRTTFEGVDTGSEVRDIVLAQGDKKFGIHFGVFGRIQVAGLFIQPELLFTQSNGEIVVNEQESSTVLNTLGEASQRVNRFDIPVMVGWTFGPAKVFLGPVATFNINEKSEVKEILQVETQSGFKNAVFGYQAGIGLDIFKFATFDIKYEGNLSKFGDTMVIGGVPRQLDARNPMWIFSLGIYL